MALILVEERCCRRLLPPPFAPNAAHSAGSAFPAEKISTLVRDVVDSVPWR